MLLCCAGKNPADNMLDAMMAEAPGPINFTMFLTMFGDKLNGTDPEDVIKNAFACFDEDNKGYIYALILDAVSIETLLYSRHIAGQCCRCDSVTDAESLGVAAFTGWEHCIE